MSNYLIREYKNEDIEQLTALWLKNFDDEEHFVSEFFRMLKDVGTGLVAEIDGKIAGAAYVLCGQELISEPSEPFSEHEHAPICGYIYAVAVNEEFRHNGIGGALVKAAAEKAREREADVVTILPAEESLYGWYEELIGVKCALYRKKETIKSAPLELYMPLSSTEYMLWRENMLKDRPHLHLSNPSLELEKIMCVEYGGGFYAAGCGIAAAYKDGDKGIIRELICADESERQIVAASIGAALGVEEVELYSPADEGEFYIAADRDIIPKNCVWNLSFD